MGTICKQNGWSESNRPTCVACQNPIGVRGDTPDVAVLMGEVLECQDEHGKVLWVAHFHCRMFDWQFAHATDVWFKRSIFDRVYLLMSDRPDWAEKISRSLVAHRTPCTHDP